ncbi:MAG: MBL fold metallo-hydrolase [Thermoprotei archaeon]
MSTRIRFLGGALEVGKEGVLVSDGSHNILLDYGSTVSDENPRFPEHLRPADLDAAVLSHAHLDHSGALPYLYINNGPEVFLTEPTLELGRLLLRDFLNISGEKLPYEFVEVEKMSGRATLVNYGESVSRRGFEMSFANAGHIPGSMMTTLNLDSKRILFTGDFNMIDTRLLKGAEPASGEYDAVIMEGTYSNKDHADRHEMEKELVDACNQVVEEGGTVLIPAFSVGRSHEVVAALRANGFKHEVHLDGMAREAGEIILRYPTYLRDHSEVERALNSVDWIDSWGSRKRAVRTPGVVVSPAGMLRGGAAVFYMEHVAFEKKNAVFLVSYQAVNTPGRMLIESGKLPFRGKLRNVEAKVRSFDFSSHSGKSSLIKFIQSLSGKPKVYLLHGEAESLKAFAEEMTQRSGLSVHAPSVGETVELD